MFRRTVTGRFVLRLDDLEKGLLGSLIAQLADLLAPKAELDPMAAMVGIDPEAERSDDPALARLFPDAYSDDDEAASEFRRFTERSLRDLKIANAQTALETLTRAGQKVTLSAAEAQAWLLTLTDLRLALAARREIIDDDWERPDDDDPRAVNFGVYDWLTYLQESLVQTLIEGPTL